MKIFIDSSFFVALFKRDDQHYAKALAIYNLMRDEIVSLYTSFYIIDETVTVLSRRVSRKTALKFLQAVKDEDFPVILESDQNVRLKTYKLFKKLKDKNISMIDCYSVILMKEHRIKKCLTFDKHFKKMGFGML